MTGDKIKITLADNLFTIHDEALAALCTRLPGVVHVERYEDFATGKKVAKIEVRTSDVAEIRQILEDAGHEIEVAK